MDEIKKPEAEVDAATAELPQKELDKVAGGGTVSPSPKPVHQDVGITKYVDKSSPTMF